MMTHHHLTPFLCLAAGFSAAQAQPTVALNTTRHTTESVTSGISPRKTLAGESPVYVKIYGFYGLLTPGSQVESSSSSISTGTTTSSFKTNSKGLGAGPRAGIGIGAIVSEFINLGIDAEMMLGADLKTDNTYVGSNYKYTSTNKTTFRVLSIIPNITFKALSRPSYYIYNRLGLVGGIVLDYKTVQTSLNVPTTGASTTGEYTADFKKTTIAFGYQAALGVQFRISQSLRGFAEVVAYNQSFQPKEIQNSSVSTKSGVATKSNTITQYKDEGIYSSSPPYQAPSYNIAMNSVGVSAGILFRF
ncbi:hypothetical protein [Spirosoma luteum]|uniref:hypothetical protein n=1 Tax=Spirosoma luteum TaxID=431553 RepID=UPI0003613289|nr:hypothetical protein [Spirosoma luteum]